MRRVLWLWPIVTALGCAQGPRAERAPTEPPTREPLRSNGRAGGRSEPDATQPTRVLDLPVPGFEPAVVVAPESEQALPLVIASHGAGGDAIWQCQHWANIVRGRAFVLCPRGKRISQMDE